MKKNIYNVLIVILLLISMYCIFKIFQIQLEYKIGNNTYKSLDKYVQNIDEKDTIKIANEITKKQKKKVIDKYSDYPSVNFKALRSINSDVLAWIYYKDTPINYPILKCDDNEYYLTHLFNRKKNSSGAIFMDYRNKGNFTDKNNIIYGHNMKNGTMFSGLLKLKNQDYYDSHKNIIIISENDIYELELFSAYTTDVYDDSWKLEFSDDDELLAWAINTKKKSIFKSDINLLKGEKYVSLSTCTYDFNDARFIVVGRLKKI